jgi:N,N'-diacetyllegionaminate synthase
MSKRVLVIAEAGVNHNGDVEMAERLVDVAADAGADLVKFQSFVAERLASASARKADYQRARTGEAGSQLEMLRRLELSPQAHERLRRHCERRGIGFFSTGFDEQSVDMLVGMGQQRIKIPSGELTNLPFLRHVGSLGKEVLVSTGMSRMEEVATALRALEAAGTPRSRVCVMHCTTAYPAPFEDVNLRAMGAMREALGVEVGYSDHTQGIEIAIAAVALGAAVVEKHFTLDRGLPGPDHAASLEPAELRAMVTAIRHVEIALGDGRKRCMPSEASNVAPARRSLVAIAAIRRGEPLGPHNVGARRPATGISPMEWDRLMGTPARRDFAAGEAIEA